MKRINIFTGHYGSGKTEVAVNFAIKNRVDMIADLDTVNPYFRTNDARGVLEGKGIRVISPYYAGTNLDIPALPPEVYSVFAGKNKAVLDVGGDDDGAYVLGRFHEYFEKERPEVYFVVNIFRPETDSLEKIVEMVHAVECSSRLNVTSLINNSNLMDETERSHILRGEEIVRAASARLGVEFFGNAAVEHLAKAGELSMKRYINM